MFIIVRKKLFRRSLFNPIDFSDEVQIFSRINRNIYKPPVAEATKEIVRKNFTRELEFFDFCKQRLHKQYLALNLDQKP